MSNPLPEDWLATLADVQTQFPGAVIYGGALRDLTLGLPVKDLDVFLPLRETFGVGELWRSRMRKLTWADYEPQEYDFMGSLGGRAQVGVCRQLKVFRYSAGVFNDLPVDLVGVELRAPALRQALKYNPIPLNAVLADADGVWQSHGFTADVAAQQVTLLEPHTMDENRRAIELATKLDWPLRRVPLAA